MSDSEKGYQDFLEQTRRLHGIGASIPDNFSGAEKFLRDIAPRLKEKLKEPLVHESVGKLVTIKCSAAPFQLISLEIAPTLANDPDLLSTYIISGVNSLAIRAHETAGIALMEVAEELRKRTSKEKP